MPPASCLSDPSPVALVTGLADPYALAASATSLFVGQVATAKPLLRIPKAGEEQQSLVDEVNSVDFILVRKGMVYFSEETAVRAVSAFGGSPQVLVSASRPAGIDVTDETLFVADFFGAQLLEMNWLTQETKVLNNLSLPEIYRVAAATGVGVVYFSSSFGGIGQFHLETGTYATFGTPDPSARVLRIFGDYVYYTVPTTVQLYRLKIGTSDRELISDLSAIGDYLEAFDSDGTSIYVALEAGVGSGRIVRVPMAGGEATIVADAQGPRPAGVIVDDACIYWTERESGSVFRARKTPSQ